MTSRVLVVDDDFQMGGLIQEVLRSVDIESLALTSSREALAHLVKEKFDAIFLDVHMPPPDGIELTRKIRGAGLNHTTPIVVITGEDDRALLARAFDAGASFFLFKPIDRHDILRLVRVTQDSIEQERRRFRRIKVRCNVTIECGSDRLAGFTLDLSLGGMFVQTSRVFPIGTLLQVGLEMNPGSPLAFVARVLRVSGGDCMGLQFESAGIHHTKALQDFLLPLIPAKSS